MHKTITFYAKKDFLYLMVNAKTQSTLEYWTEITDKPRILLAFYFWL